jgi:hypothetical protein
VAEAKFVAICCHRNRAVAVNRCEHCDPALGCLTFGSVEELAHFNRLIPPSMVGSPLPLNLWPKVWKAVDPESLTKPVMRWVSPVEVLVWSLGIEKRGRDKY